MGGPWVSHPQHIRPRLEKPPDGGGYPEVVLLRILGLRVTIEIIEQFHLPNEISEELIAEFAVEGQPNAAQITQAGKSGKGNVHADFREVVGKDLCVQAGHSLHTVNTGIVGKVLPTEYAPSRQPKLGPIGLDEVMANTCTPAAAEVQAEFTVVLKRSREINKPAVTEITVEVEFEGVSIDALDILLFAEVRVCTDTGQILRQSIVSGEAEIPGGHPVSPREAETRVQRSLPPLPEHVFPAG